MKSDTLQTIKAFCRVVETGSFVQASDDLSIAKSTLSDNIKSLETRLGITLLHRSTRKVAPTTAGLHYYQKIKPLVSEFDNIDTEFRTGLSQISGTLTVATTEVISQCLIVPNLAGFLRAYPKLRLSIHASSRNSDLLGEMVDCAVRAGKIVDDSLIHRQIGAYRFWLCASADFADKFAISTPQSLNETTYIGFTHPFGVGLSANELVFTQNEQRQIIKPTPILNFDNMDTCKTAILAHLGVGVLPQAVAEPLVKSGELVRILADWDLPSLPVYLAYHKTERHSVKMKAFGDWLTGLFEWSEIWGS